MDLYAQVIERFTKLGLAAKTKDADGKERDLITLPTYIPKGDVGVGIKAEEAARGVACEVEGCDQPHHDPSVKGAETTLRVIKAANRVEELRHLARAAEVEVDDKFEERLLTFTASDETVDRYGDVILVDGELKGKKYGKGWDVRNFQRNPVFMPFHSYSEVPLGVALETWTDQKGSRKRLRMTVLMDDGEACPIAPRVLKAFKSRLMRTVSVGFLPLKDGVHIPQDENQRKEWGLGDYGYLFAHQELLENSAVSIPANPNAKLEGLDAGEAIRLLRFASEVKGTAPELAYQIRHMLKTGAGMVEVRRENDLTEDDLVREDPPQNTRSCDHADLLRAFEALSKKVDDVLARNGAEGARVAEGASGQGGGGSQRNAGDPEGSDPYEPLIRGFERLHAAATR